MTPSEDAERLGEWVDDVAGDGHVGPLPTPADGGNEGPLAWHALGPVHVETVACPSFPDLAATGKRLYALRLPHDQAGVAWTHYHLRRQALETAITLGRVARALVGRIQTAPAAALARLGAELYRRQRAGAAITPAEWRRVWRAYRARRPRAA